MRHLLLVAALLLAAPTISRSAEATTDQKTQEILQMHRKMAELHKKAADCIASGRPVKDCHSEAMKDCPMIKSAMCPFMEGMGTMRRRRQLGRP